MSFVFLNYLLLVISSCFCSERIPAGPGTVVSGVPGQGYWRTFEGTDGLSGGIVFAILEDRQGYLWFATSGGGVSRYNGQTFRQFTTQDGLAHNNVWAILKAQDGSLWFGTRGGPVGMTENGLKPFGPKMVW